MYWRAVVISLLLFPSIVFAAVNINTAGSTELQTLNGIGPAYAQNIIDYRNDNGAFTTIEEIMNVSGIGPATFEKIKNDITVGTVDEEEDEEEEEEEGDAAEDEEENTSGGGGGPSYPLGGETLTVKAWADREYASVRTPVTFTGEAWYGDRESATARTMWNFGNGYTDIGDEVVYAYDHPGEYVVTFSAKTFEEEIFTTFSIEIVDPEIVISDIVQGPRGYVEIENKTDRQYDLSRWKIYSGGTYYRIAPYTFIAPGSKLRFNATRMNLEVTRYGTVLKYPDGTTAAIYTETVPQTYVQAPQEVKKEGKVEIDEKEDKRAATTSQSLAAVGGTTDTDNSSLLWIILLVGLVTIGSIIVLLLKGSHTSEEEDFTIV